jgi:hypothetical protein
MKAVACVYGVAYSSLSYTPLGVAYSSLSYTHATARGPPYSSVHLLIASARCSFRSEQKEPIYVSSYCYICYICVHILLFCGVLALLYSHYFAYYVCVTATSPYYSHCFCSPSSCHAVAFHFLFQFPNRHLSSLLCLRSLSKKKVIQK